jgi:GDP-mannose 6-dehydrogenase
LPHLSELIINDLEQGIQESDVVVINHKDFDPASFLHLLEEKHTIIDLMRNSKIEALPNYEGICW